MKRRWIRLWCLLPLPAALLIRKWAQAHPEALEKIYSAGIYPLIAAPLSKLSSSIPFPLVIPAFALLVLGILFCLYKKKFLYSAAILLGAAALFIGGWGLNYARVPVEESLGLDVRKSTLEELEALCIFLGEEAEAAWLENTGIPQSNEILKSVSRAYQKAGEHWDILPKGDWGNPKAAPGTKYLTRWWIEGITIPFTLEALVNEKIPLLFQPYVACHESAHLRGFAREEDANFLAYLVCRESEDAFFRCSGALNAYIYAFNALYRADRERAGQVAQSRGEFLQEALREHSAFWKPYEGTEAAAVSTAVNDLYLKTVGQEQSVASYGRVVDLLLAWKRLETMETEK